ncbi:hypothetical protein AX14_000419 [Amanita brunnescens Koide BX004]|nr:hypothetical protein AX14_000760 [Amanita brunnescens Koide BX004]KAF8701488.1 hypothetical protein AX14_000419 [Amanita brunnescens Koide BX004]
MSDYVFYDPFVYHLSNGALTSRCKGRRHDDRANKTESTVQPRMDLHEDTQNNTVTATFEFPGVSKENVSIDMQNGSLTVTAENNISSEHDENGYTVRERRWGKFSRTLQLPQGIKDSEVKASMENGVLTVIFPKTTPEMASKKIQIA